MYLLRLVAAHVEIGLHNWTYHGDACERHVVEDMDASDGASTDRNASFMLSTTGLLVHVLVHPPSPPGCAICRSKVYEQFNIAPRLSRPFSRYDHAMTNPYTVATAFCPYFAMCGCAGALVAGFSDYILTAFISAILANSISIVAKSLVCARLFCNFVHY